MDKRKARERKSKEKVLRRREKLRAVTSEGYKQGLLAKQTRRRQVPIRKEEPQMVEEVAYPTITIDQEKLVKNRERLLELQKENK